MSLVLRYRQRAILALLAMLAFLGAIALSDHLSVQRALSAEQVRLGNLARLTGASYQRQVDKFRLLATTLSADPDVARLLDTKTVAAATRLNQRLADLTTALDASVIYLLDQRGTTIASSNWRQTDSFLNENYGFRAYFTKAMSDGQWEQYALGTRSRIPGLFVARRVRTADGIDGVIVVKIRFDRLEREWALSAGTAFVASAQGVILVSSLPSWRFQTLRRLDESEQRLLRAQVEFGKAPLVPNAAFATKSVISGTAAYDLDAEFMSATEPLPNGLAVYVLAPLREIVGAARTMGRLLVLVLFGIVAGLAAFYAWRRRSIIAAEQRESATRIAALKDRLVQANQLSSLGQMAAGIGHEINQPLTAIGVRAQNAAKLIEAGRTTEAASAVEDIRALTARMGAITNELRVFARRADGRVGRVSLAAVLDGTRLLLSDRLRTTETTFHVEPIDVTVIGDQGRLEQVFVNLIQNALDAMGESGRIDLLTNVVGPTVEITIRDSGPGIAADIRERLFQPFTTSKAHGLGLGLVICRDIIADFGGELVLAPSSLGTAFMMRLPIAP